MYAHYLLVLGRHSTESSLQVSLSWTDTVNRALRATVSNNQKQRQVKLRPTD